MTPQRNINFDRLSQLLLKVQRKYGQSPLSEVGQKLEQLILLGQSQASLNALAPMQATSVLNFVQTALELLPQSFSDRFYFDAAQIQVLAEQLSQEKIKLSQMIIPRHERDWGHRSIPMPSEISQMHHVVDIIHIPGDDNLEDVNLLEYPFLCHELAHNILFRDDSFFKGSFEPKLNQVLNTQRLAGISDRGITRGYAKKITDDVSTIWYPSPTQKNWAHELACDVIALWLCGPSYLEALGKVMTATDTNPYDLDPTYPPYEVRALSLITASKSLGWNNSVDAIEAIISDWRHSRWKNKRTNQYIAFANAELVTACALSALQLCNSLVLPRCTPQKLNTIQQNLQLGQVPEFGMDLILAAWIFSGENDETKYAEWQKRTLAMLVNSITQ